jgi:hypothetical protein
LRRALDQRVGDAGRQRHDGRGARRALGLQSLVYFD